MEVVVVKRPEPAVAAAGTSVKALLLALAVAIIWCVTLPSTVTADGYASQHPTVSASK